MIQKTKYLAKIEIPITAKDSLEAQKIFEFIMNQTKKYCADYNTKQDVYGELSLCQ